MVSNDPRDDQNVIQCTTAWTGEPVNLIAAITHHLQGVPIDPRELESAKHTRLGPICTRCNLDIGIHVIDHRDIQPCEQLSGGATTQLSSAVGDLRAALLGRGITATLSLHGEDWTLRVRNKHGDEMIHATEEYPVTTERMRKLADEALKWIGP